MEADLGLTERIFLKIRIVLNPHEPLRFTPRKERLIDNLFAEDTAEEIQAGLWLGHTPNAP